MCLKNAKRCYCVVAQDMRFNDVVTMTPQEMTMVQLKFGDRLVIADWTETFNIQPDQLDQFKGEKYGVETSQRITYKDLMSMCTDRRI
tara:strand:- start:110 stop:373 length:264 start_codon:yes stop_codon:yes gene_type:complete